MSAPRTDAQIKKAISLPIIAEIGADDSGNKPKVYPWNVLKPLGVDDKDRSKVLAEWAGIFSYTPIIQTVPEIAYGDPLIHGWMIKRVERPSELSNSDCALYSPVYDIWGFYGFRMGNKDSNSEDEFNDISDKIADRFEGGLLPVNNGLVDTHLAHTGFQIIIESTLRTGDRAMHFKACRIEFQFGD